MRLHFDPERKAMNGTVNVRRLRSDDHELARDVFRVMAQVFEEPSEAVDADHVRRLLDRESFWAFAACADDEVIGGLTAHVLPMTRAASAELFIYDVAVRDEWQRQGVGRRLMMAACEEARREGLDNAFVLAETADTHALDFYRALGGDAMSVTMFTFDVSGSGADVA